VRARARQAALLRGERLSARSHARAARGAPGVTRDWNAPPPAGGPPPAAALQELKDWKAAREKQRLLEEGLPLPPELRPRYAWSRRGRRRSRACAGCARRA